MTSLPAEEKWRLRKYRMWIEQQGKCGICTEELEHEMIYNTNLVNEDHYIPKSRGGSRGRHNMQLAHKRCNDLKKDAMPNGAFIRRVVDSDNALSVTDAFKHGLWMDQEFTCGICHDDIKPSELYREEHVIVSKRVPPRWGGTRERFNLNLTHLACHVNAQVAVPYWVVDNLPELGDRRAV